MTDYTPSDTFAVCGYCGTKFVIEREPPKPPPFAPTPARLNAAMSPQQLLMTIAACAAIGLGLIIFIVIVSNKKNQPETPYVGYTPPTPRTLYTPPPSPTPTPNLNLLEFGGKGTGNGLFNDADSIAVDGQGRIYVGDDSLRVQQFDAQGKFLKLWQIPSQTKFYRRARTIQKVAVDQDNRLYVLVGGTLLIYENDGSEPSNTLESAPSALQDFALRSDGGILIMSNNGSIETLIILNKNKKLIRSIKGFHTDTADASMSPASVGLAAIRIAVDGTGNIYSIYALGDLGSYQLSYNPEDFMTFRFTPEGRYVNKFFQTMNSVGIEVDNQSRIYISNNKSIIVYSNIGESFSLINNLAGVNAFALDKENNVYIVHNDLVIKRAAVQQ